MADLHKPKGHSMGIRFHPTNREVMKYLLGFAIDEPLPEQHQLMQLVDLYGDKNPWDIVEDNNTRYFITKLKKEKAHHKNCKRIVGVDGGYWKKQDQPKKVFDSKSRLMGYVHHLKYTHNPTKSFPEKPSIMKDLFGEWLMTEYSLYDGYVPNIKKKNYVICKIKKKEEKSKKDDENRMMSEVEVDEFMKSVLEEDNDIDDHIMEGEDGGDVGDEFLVVLEGCNDDDKVEENGTSGDNLPAHHHINLDDYDFV